MGPMTAKFLWADEKGSVGASGAVGSYRVFVAVGGWGVVGVGGRGGGPGDCYRIDGGGGWQRGARGEGAAELPGEAGWGALAARGDQAGGCGGDDHADTRPADRQGQGEREG